MALFRSLFVKPSWLRLVTFDRVDDLIIALRSIDRSVIKVKSLFIDHRSIDEIIVIDLKSSLVPLGRGPIRLWLQLSSFLALLFSTDNPHESGLLTLLPSVNDWEENRPPILQPGNDKGGGNCVSFSLLLQQHLVMTGWRETAPAPLFLIYMKKTRGDSPDDADSWWWSWGFFCACFLWRGVLLMTMGRGREISHLADANGGNHAPSPPSSLAPALAHGEGGGKIASPLLLLLMTKGDLIGYEARQALQVFYQNNDCNRMCWIKIFNRVEAPRIDDLTIHSRWSNHLV